MSSCEHLPQEKEKKYIYTLYEYNQLDEDNGTCIQMLFVGL